jgi:hypothetical protein
MSVLAAGYSPTSERPSLPVYFLKAKMFQLLASSKKVLVLDPPLRIFGGLHAIYAPTQNNFEYFSFTICSPGYPGP